MLQPANVSTPAVALFGFAVQVSVAPPATVKLRVIEAVLVVTVLPLASSTVTVGWVAKAVPALAEPLGSVVKISWVAVLAVILNALLVAAVIAVVLSVAVSV